MIRLKKITKKTSTIVGAGLVALDVILNGSPSTPAKLCAGGSCGNVLSILSFLGWNSKPVARLSTNNATKNLFKDFVKFQIDTSLITSTDDGKTPIIIHRILKDEHGKPKHKFEFKIPGTTQWLPMYKPVLASFVQNIIERQPLTKVFYFDRVSRSALDLATYYRNNGALVVFEPSSLKNDKLTLKCLKISHIIKYSSDRITNYADSFPTPNAALEIETLGQSGLRYRLKSDKNYEWKIVPSYKFDNTVDSAGAGDWCTAGIINELGFNGKESFEASSENRIIRALKIGQALGGFNCMFDGARGIMYNIIYEDLINYIESILNNDVTNDYRKSSTSVDILTIEDLNFSSLVE